MPEASSRSHGNITHLKMNRVNDRCMRLAFCNCALRSREQHGYPKIHLIPVKPHYYTFHAVFFLHLWDLELFKVTCKLKSAASEWLLWGRISSAYLSLLYLWNYSIRLISITETSVLIRRYRFLRDLWSEKRNMKLCECWYEDAIWTVQPVICLQTLTERRACGKVL